jgi:hypothetical protein
MPRGGYSKYISHKGPPSGAQFDDIPVRGPTPGNPLGENPHTDDFTKHLRDFGGCDEVSPRAKRVGRCSVVSVIGVSEALGYVCR